MRCRAGAKDRLPTVKIKRALNSRPSLLGVHSRLGRELPGALGEPVPMRKAGSTPKRSLLRRKPMWEANDPLADAPNAGPAGSPDGPAVRDQLTGAHNRNYLVERLNAACLDAAQRRSQFAVFVLGIERLA